EQELVHFPCCCFAGGIARQPFVQARRRQLSHHLLPMRMLGDGQWDDLVPLRVEPEMLGKDRSGSCRWPVDELPRKTPVLDQAVWMVVSAGLGGMRSRLQHPVPQLR